MGTPQPALFVDELAHHAHLEWTLRADSTSATAREAVAAARRAAATLCSPASCWGFDPMLWRRWSACPDNVRPFAEVTGPGGTAPATQRSVWLWLAGNAHEKLWESARAASREMLAVADRTDELWCYSPFDNRDPIGFVDGTENPALDEAIQVAVYPSGQVGAGGSAVLLQKWVHDLTAFEALPVVDQEAVIGRTRVTDEELDPKPVTAHNARTVVTDAHGEERHILRRNTPYASVAETGTMFIGCTNDPPLMDEMVARMFGTSADGLTDHLTRYSTPVTGSYYFVPPVEDLTTVFGPLESDD